MSVDPFIQAPANSQSMNPYSYIMNNPLSGTDPTGYKGEQEEVKTETVKVAATTGSRLKGSKTTKTTTKADGSVTEKTTVSNGAGQTTSSSFRSGSIDNTTIGDQNGIASTSVGGGTPSGNSQENDTPIIHRVTGDNSPDYYTDDGTPAWVTTAPCASSSKEGIRNPSQPKPRARSGGGFWREIGRVYGKGSSGTFVGSRKVKLNFFDEQGLAIANGMHFSINYQQLGKDGKPIPTYSSEAHGQLMKALPMGLTYELYGGDVDRFSWHVKSKNTQASCDTCGAGGIKVSEFVYE